jgi:hypothetical protein
LVAVTDALGRLFGLKDGPFMNTWWLVLIKRWSPIWKPSGRPISTWRRRGIRWSARWSSGGRWSRRWCWCPRGWCRCCGPSSGGTCQVRQELEDGRSVVRLAAPTPLMIAQYLAGWGALLEVRESAAVRAELARLGAELVERHAT